MEVVNSSDDEAAPALAEAAAAASPAESSLPAFRTPTSAPHLGLRSGASEAVIARRLAEQARMFAGMATRTSPFSVNANKAGFEFLGGKMDDITVVAAQIVFSPPTPLAAVSSDARGSHCSPVSPVAFRGAGSLNPASPSGWFDDAGREAEKENYAC
jgi:hypothetical protein